MTTPRPPAPALAWAKATLSLAPGFTIGPLTGSRSGRVWRIDDADGRQTAVLKLAASATHGGDERLIGREAVILDALAPLELPVPRVIASDPSGESAGTPALLLTLAQGSLVSGRERLRGTIPALAEALALCQCRTRSLVAGRRWRPREPEGGHQVPTWSTREALWNRAIRVAQRFQAPPCDAFIQRDAHPANMLLDGGQVSAIVDWPHAGRGPGGFDCARMAASLCCLVGMDAATTFRHAFEEATRRRHDPLLDVFAACEFLPDPVAEANAEALGIELTRNQARGRLENFLADAMRRMTSRRLS